MKLKSIISNNVYFILFQESIEDEHKKVEKNMAELGDAVERATNSIMVELDNCGQTTIKSDIDTLVFKELKYNFYLFLIEKFKKSHYLYRPIEETLNKIERYKILAKVLVVIIMSFSHIYIF